MKRGRPKGKSNDTRSFGPLGDLIRKHRLERSLGLADVAKACHCSVQFISNIEHGRAPLPWEKVAQLATFLKIPLEDLQAANLAIRSDFKSFVRTSKVPVPVGKQKGLSGKATLSGGVASAASAIAFTVKDPILRDLIQKYQVASMESRKKFVKSALSILVPATDEVGVLNQEPDSAPTAVITAPAPMPSLDPSNS